MKEIKFYKSPLKALKLLLLSLPFIIFSLLDIINHSHVMPIALAWIGLCFFGMAISVAIFQIFDRRPQIIISKIGIFDRTAYKEMVNWELIQNAYPVKVHNQKLICLILDEKALPLLKVNRVAKSLSKAMGFQEVNLSLGQ